MRKERQIEILQRVADAGPDLRGLHARASMTNSASAYTDTERFAVEQRLLFREAPVFFALSADVPTPGSSRAMRVGGVPIVVVRQQDGSLVALINACRHRGAPVVAEGSRTLDVSALSCPYHAWTYELDGVLRKRPASAGAFEDVSTSCDLLTRPVAEKYGLIFVRPRGDARVCVDEILAGAEDDLGAFALENYVLIESRSREWNMNWKLAYDTFAESYHIRTLHRASIGPMFNSDCLVFEPFGKNLLAVGLRSNVRDEFKRPRELWSLLPYGTIQYFLVPTGLVVHQLDHVEVWNIEPVSVDRTRLTTSIYAPSEPQTAGERQHFVKNLDLLLEVTGAEDFPLMEQIQLNLSSGAMPELIYGRNEPPLIHFHTEVNRAIGADR